MRIGEGGKREGGREGGRKGVGEEGGGGGISHNDNVQRKAEKGPETDGGTGPVPPGEGSEGGRNLGF